MILEVRAGAGGDEAALFAADLLECTRCSPGNRVALRSSSPPTRPRRAGSRRPPRPRGDDVYGRLKFESGVHRVQRVPATETQGRVHTSTASVAVLPQAETVELDIRDDDLKIDTSARRARGVST